jgi:hypothetical protein
MTDVRLHCETDVRIIYMKIIQSDNQLVNIVKNLVHFGWTNVMRSDGTESSKHQMLDCHTAPFQYIISNQVIL